MKDLGAQIKSYRLAKKMTQAQLAQLAGISHKNIISSFERGKTIPSITQTLPKICQVLGVSMSIILTSEEISE